MLLTTSPNKRLKDFLKFRLYVEKNDLKVTKNRLFGYGILTTFGKSHFSTMKIENNYNKVYSAKNYIE